MHGGTSRKRRPQNNVKIICWLVEMVAFENQSKGVSFE